MSLINEALKKAQKVRTGDSPTDLPPMPGGEPFAGRRGQPRSTQTILMLTAGGAALVIVSVVITFWLVNRAPAEKSAAAPVAAKAAPTPSTTPAPATAKPTTPATAPASATTQPAQPETVAKKPETPASAQPTAGSAPAVKPTVVASTPTAAPAAVPPPTPATELATATPEAASQSPGPAVPPVTSAPVRGDERVHAFVDAIKVAGIRPSGNDSRVLMNDRVFRVNDIVERNLGVRLTKVEADALTFTDVNGAVYVKNF